MNWNENETDRMNKRILEIQENMNAATPEQAVDMLNELLDMVSKIENAFNEANLDINQIENEEN